VGNELTELLNIALDRELVSQAFYVAGQKKTTDPGAIELMKELAYQELKHSQIIKEFMDGHPDDKVWITKKLPELMITEYLADINLSEAAMLQDVITIAMKREQSSVEFYNQMQQATGSPPVKQLCQRLIQEEKNHKSRLESFYEDLFYKEN
jgi:rubrerythrin